MAIDPQDRVYVVDMFGRIQVFDTEGTLLRGWATPAIELGKPTGLGIAQDGAIMVADTHYSRVLFYSVEGVLDEPRTIGGKFGDNPGEFHWVTDVCQDARGHYFVGQYGQIDQIQEFSPDGQYIRRWGRQGRELGEFARPQALAVDNQGLLWVADGCNHRIQVFRVDGPMPELIMQWGKQGNRLGELQYPYGLAFEMDGTVLIAEYGNHRVQHLTREGQPLEMWGKAGSQGGQFNTPWAVALDSKRRVFVLDTLNHRVQRFSANRLI
jgi:hypothetical protein